MGQIGVSRKVDPEEAIDTTARRARSEAIEPPDNIRQDRASFKINLSAREAREDARRADEKVERRKNYEPGPRGINVRYR